MRTSNAAENLTAEQMQPFEESKPEEKPQLKVVEKPNEELEELEQMLEQGAERRKRMGEEQRHRDKITREIEDQKAADEKEISELEQKLSQAPELKDVLPKVKETEEKPAPSLDELVAKEMNKTPQKQAEEDFYKETKETLETPSTMDNFTADLEYKAIKNLKGIDKENLDALLQMRVANDKVMFNNFLNGLYVEEQKNILPILKLREDTADWAEEWEQNGTSAGEKPKSFFGKLKDKFKMKFGSN